jgi:uncharacterized protein with NRDE domain
VQSNKTPHEIATEVAKEADEYNGFNLILADLTTNIMVHVSNRPKVSWDKSVRKQQLNCPMHFPS